MVRIDFNRLRFLVSDTMRIFDPANLLHGLRRAKVYAAEDGAAASKHSLTTCRTISSPTG